MSLTSHLHRIRRKKCDEDHPTCGQCKSTGRRCDFESVPCSTSIIPASPSSQAPISLSVLGVSLLDYFRTICTKEIALVFNSSAWEGILLRLIGFEPFACHIALAISALTRVHYSVVQPVATPLTGVLSFSDYADKEYALAIQALNMRLDQTGENAELAVVASVIFCNMEFLRATGPQPRQMSLVGLHVEGGLRVLHNLQHSTEYPKLVCSWDFLEHALSDMRSQLDWLHLSNGRRAGRALHN